MFTEETQRNRTGYCNEVNEIGSPVFSNYQYLLTTSVRLRSVLIKFRMERKCYFVVGVENLVILQNMHIRLHPINDVGLIE